METSNEFYGTNPDGWRLPYKTKPPGGWPGGKNFIVGYSTTMVMSPFNVYSEVL